MNDSRNDLRLLREQIVRQRVGSYIEGLNTSCELNTRSQMSTSLSTSSLSTVCSAQTALSVKETFIKEIELLRDQKNLIENDLKLAICQKEEIEIERDSFKDKYLKLNKFLLDSSTDLNNNNKEENLNNRISYNIDEIMSQNKYLNETNKSLKEELEILKNNLKKYKQAMLQQQQQPGKQETDFSNLPETNLLNKVKIKYLLKRAEDFLSENKTLQQNDSVGASVYSLVSELKLVLESFWNV